MRRILLAVLGWTAWTTLGSDPMPAAAPPAALILYDQSDSDDFIGGLHARLLANLLGHFRLDYQIRSVHDYQAGDAGAFAAVFYLGTSFDPPLPAAFLEDAATVDLPFCWFKYNLWQLSDHLSSSNFLAQFGYRVDQVDSSGYPEIRYQGESFSKDPGDPDLVRVTLEQDSRAQTFALAWKSDSETIPYAVKSGRFWYVADSPFSFTSEEDRYLVFADLLHDILEIDHPVSRKALLRLEDITPDYPAGLLEDAAAVLTEEAVPFGISLIPLHSDPLGLFTGGISNQVTLAQRPDLVEALRLLIRSDGQILLHGYTHQYRNVPNPYSAVSGDDFEFFRVTLDAEGNLETFAPVPEDSLDWVQGRIDAARAELRAAGLSESAWVTPHYTASPLDYAVFAANFSLSVQRGTYFDDAGHDASQIFPYEIHRDIYGQRILPENLGNITSDQAPAEERRTVEDVLRAARKTRVVRDGWASLFFHPFLEPETLRELIQGIRGLGYEFVPVTTNRPPNVSDQSPDQHRLLGGDLVLSVDVRGSEPIAYQWFRDGTPLEGATAPELPITNVAIEDFGAYTVSVSNPFGWTVCAPIHVRFLATPSILAAHVTNGVFRLWFESEPGLRYAVEYRDFLDSPIRSTTLPVTAPGGRMSVDAPLGGLGQRFYQLTVN